MRTGTVSYKLEDLKNGVIIPIGFVGENDFTRVIFDAEEIYKKFPNASVSMKVQPPKGVIYPATVTRDGNAVIWQVKEADVANRGGGELQLTFTDGETKIKTYIAKTDVKRSLAGNGPAPDPIQDFVDNANEKLAEVDDALADLAAMDNIAKNAQESDIGKSLSPKTVVDGVVTEWQYTEPSGGTDDYTDLDNKPQIAGVTLSGNKSLTDLGIASEESLGELSGEVTNVKSDIQGLEDDKYEKPSGGIPATDMTQAVQDALADAESAYQKPSGGIPASDIADGVIPVVDSALSYSSENAVQNKVVRGALDTKAPVIINTATGNPAVFNDGGGMPIKSLLIQITPKQSGSGEPSPSNIRPFLPWNGLTVYQSGADTSNPTETDIVFPSPVYGGTLDVVTGELWATWFVNNCLWSDKWYGAELTNVERRAFKLPNGVIPHTMSYYNDHKSETKCNIAPLLWSYDLDDTHYYIDKDGDYYRALVFLPIGTSEDTQIQVGGTLADPVLITTLTPQHITALVGDNTIWSDADGQMTVEYPADTETFIANQHRNFIAPELSSMIADTALVKNDFRIVGNNLYKITTAIASGGTLTPNTNCVKTTLTEVIKPLLT